ncbi:MAG: FkbM family methyltransferase, partial [Pseudanabaena sp.]
NKIDVIKMDVEGLELSVLEGLMESNIIFPRNIIFEYIPNSFSHAYDAAMYLINKGYDLYDVLGNPYDINTKETLIDLNLWAKKENE